jgi:acyl dehydratase
LNENNPVQTYVDRLLGEARMSDTARAASGPLFLDDLQVGQRFASGSHRLDADQIRAFAELYDPQPFHLDNDRAKGTLFGGLAASGWHTAAITMRLLVESGLPLAGGIIGTGGEVSWPKPTRAGDTLRVFSEIEEITPSRSRPDRGMIRVRSETRNQDGEIVQVLMAKLVVPRRTTGEATAAAPDPAVQAAQP